MKNPENDKFIKYVQSRQNLELKLKTVAKRSRYNLLFCMISFMVMGYVVVHQPTYIVPYGLDKKVKVSINRVDSTYLSLLARNDAATYFNVTPQSVVGASGIFLTRIRPDYFGDTQVDLKKREKEYVNDNKSTLFYPEDNTVVTNESVSLKGNLITVIGNKITNQRTITLSITYAIDNGMTYIKRWHYE